MISIPNFLLPTITLNNRWIIRNGCRSNLLVSLQLNAYLNPTNFPVDETRMIKCGKCRTNVDKTYVFIPLLEHFISHKNRSHRGYLYGVLRSMLDLLQLYESAPRIRLSQICVRFLRGLSGALMAYNQNWNAAWSLMSLVHWLYFCCISALDMNTDSVWIRSICITSHTEKMIITRK